MAHSFERRDVTFDSGGLSCAAWLYLLASASRPPVVVMAHGLGAVREMRLDAYAERFAAAGYACLVFDYRHFGASEGEPRQLLDIERELEDWAAAVRWVRERPDLDGGHVALWGTSFSGGHVLVTAAGDAEIAAVIAQCPFTDGLASVLASDQRSSIRVLARALADEVGRVLGRPPVMVPAVGKPGSTALMTAPDAEPGYLRLVPPGSTARNEVAARFALDLLRYFPGRKAARVGCPVLFCVAEKDSVAPAAATLRHARRAPRGEIRTYPVGHFDLYVDETFERVIADQLAFLGRHVPAA